MNLIEKQKLVAEGAGAVSVAAVMFNKIPVKDKKVVCLVSGGNIDVTILSRVINRGLTVGGRLSTLIINLADKPGQQSGECKVIAELGGNNISVVHDRMDSPNTKNGCVIRIELETRNADHIREIKDGLNEEGYQVM